MRRIYLSPHFDDAVLSCGGLIWEQGQAGQQIEIWTVCAGAPPEGEPLSEFARHLHERWQTGPEAVAARRAEDLEAVQRLGAVPRFWNLPDCVYRKLTDGTWLVNGEEDLWKQVNPQELPIVERLCGWLEDGLAPEDELVSPLTLGNHVDHFLVRSAAERLSRPLLYYADYPYAINAGEDLSQKTGAGWDLACQTVSAAALSAWQEAVTCYASQISTFWGGRQEMYMALEEYWRSRGGNCLWRPAILKQ